MANHKIPPQAFTNIMHKITDYEFDFSDWENSPEYRIFLAGRKHELEQTIAELNATNKYLISH